MKNAKNEIYIEVKKSIVPSCQVRKRSFTEYLRAVENKIEIESFGEDFAQAREIAMIIAEVLRLPETESVRIAGNNLPADMVADIFTYIEHEHVAEVIRRYREAKYEIKHTKTYLRTALYNSVFELNARIDNEVRKDMYGG